MTKVKQGTNVAYVAGCVGKDCREHQRIGVARNRASAQADQVDAPARLR